MFKKWFIRIGICVVVLSVFPAVGLAQVSGDVVQQATGRGFVPCGNPGQEQCGIQHIFRGVAAILEFFIAFAAIAAVAGIVWGGIQMTYSRGNMPALTTAKKKVIYSITGFVIVMISYTVVNTVFTGGSIWGGFKNGGQILTNPLCYIQGPSCTTK